MKRITIIFSLLLVIIPLSAQEIWTSIPLEANLINSIEIDPTNDSIIYLCFTPRITSYQYILAKSYDIGETWLEIGTDLGNDPIYDIEINHQNNQIVYIGTSHCIYKSINGGISWSSINQGIGDKSINDIIIDPINPDTIYCLADSDVYKSEDGGINWNCICSQFAGITLEMHPLNNNILYLGTFSDSLLLYTSIDNGITWQPIGDGLEGNYLYNIAINNNGEIFVGVNYILHGSKIYNSTDNGNTFIIVGDSLPDKVMALAIDPNTSEVYEAGKKKVRKYNNQEGYWEEFYKDSMPTRNSVKFCGTNTIWIGTWNGLLKGNINTQEFELTRFSLYNNYPVYKVQIDNNNPGVMYAFLGTGSIFKSYDYGENWYPKSNGLPMYGSIGFFLELSPFNTNKLYAGSSSFYISNYAAETWQKVDLDDDYWTCITFHPTDSLIAFSGTGDHIYRTIDGGENWQQTNIPEILINSIAINPIHPDTLFSTNLCCPGGIFISIDGGLNWQEFNLSFNGVKQIFFDNANPNSLYLVTWESLYKSFDGGYTWETLEDNLSGLRYKLYQSPFNSDHLFLWGSFGLFFSNNAGINWYDIYQGFPQGSLIYDIDFDLNRQKIICATSHHGIFVRDYVSLPSSIDDNTIGFNSNIIILNQNYPNPFNPSTTISFNLTTEFTESTELIIYNLKGQKIKTFSIPQSEFSNPNSVVWDGTDTNNQTVGSGIYFYKLKTDNFEKTRKMILLK